MTPERWRQITEIFHAALARDAVEREDFVAGKCHGDEALRHEVQAMLMAHEAARDLGETPVGSPIHLATTRPGTGDLAAPQAPAPPFPWRVGDFTLLEQGRGRRQR